MCKFFQDGFCEDRSLTDFVPCAKENCPFWAKAIVVMNETHTLTAEQKNIHKQNIFNMGNCFSTIHRVDA